MMEEISLRQRSSLIQQDDEVAPVGVLHERPAQLGFLTQFKLFFWNSEERKLMGRTAWSWVKILLFYCVFYLALCGLFAACWGVFTKLTLSDEPYRQLQESLIRPGIGFRPNSPLVEDGETTLHISATYRKNKDKRNTNDAFIGQLNKFLAPYTQPLKPEMNFKNCNDDDSLVDETFDRTKYSCFFNISKSFTDCTPDMTPDFGYSDKGHPSPCVFLKLNKIMGWEPEFYDVSDLPTDMPDQLKGQIKNKSQNSRRKLNTVWVSCEGETDTDKEHIGKITYVSDQGFSGYFFPFSKAAHYWSPLVAVKFENLTVDQQISVECRVWAKNINYNRKDGIGNIRFQLQVHSNNGLRPHISIFLIVPSLLLFIKSFIF